MQLTSLDRITASPGILGGKPCIRGTRLSVEFVLELIGGGASRADIARAYPQLAVENVDQAVRHAARFLRNGVILSSRIGG